MTPDPDMQAIEAEARRVFDRYERSVKKFNDAYHKASEPGAKLRILAEVVRRHGRFMNRNLFVSGWIANTVLQFAEAIDDCANLVDPR
jgi:hypothetical protein